MKVKIGGAMVEWYPNCHLSMTDAEWAEYRERMDALEHPNEPSTETLKALAEALKKVPLGGLPINDKGFVDWSGGVTFDEIPCASQDAQEALCRLTLNDSHPGMAKTAEVTDCNSDPMWDEDAVCRIAAVARRLYSEDRMDGDTMRNAAQMLHAVLDRVGAKDAVYTPHGTYDARLR
jgi:hypothetical protein